MGKSDYIGGRGESIASMRLDRIWRTDADLPSMRDGHDK
jgi:hypothetical protein